MSDAMRDQLLKTGLVDEKQVKKARSEQHKGKKKAKKPKKAAPPAAEPTVAEQRQAEQAERSRRKNEERQARAARKALTAQLRELVSSNLYPVPAGEDAEDYHFQQGGRIRSLPVTPALRRQLADGRAAIAGLDHRPEAGFRLVPRETADRIRERDPQWPLVIPAEEAADSEPAADDPYADYVVPDDLMW
ncbi:DUF2058 domain-containing protein [Thioalkalivibrio sp. ALE23]|uniref:DUF2058 domain-containing protein n=1 Tax=Thioalkalivibrio sp. ALE23 TaxID=1265495 RepID=UPI0004766806|nr:DUF2058 domain-containing protein [Thioalkalivibrio sp. ALE23]